MLLCCPALAALVVVAAYNMGESVQANLLAMYCSMWRSTLWMCMSTAPSVAPFAYECWLINNGIMHDVYSRWCCSCCACAATAPRDKRALWTSICWCPCPSCAPGGVQCHSLYIILNITACVCVVCCSGSGHTHTHTHTWLICFLWHRRDRIATGIPPTDGFGLWPKSVCQSSISHGIVKFQAFLKTLRSWPRCSSTACRTSLG